MFGRNLAVPGQRGGLKCQQTVSLTLRCGYRAWVRLDHKTEVPELNPPGEAIEPCTQIGRAWESSKPSAALYGVNVDKRCTPGTVVETMSKTIEQPKVRKTRKLHISKFLRWRDEASEPHILC